MIAWLAANEPGPVTRGFLEEVRRNFEEFATQNTGSLLIFLGLLALGIGAIVVKKLLAPRAQRAMEIGELFDRLSEANRLTAEERKRLEEAAAVTLLENPAHLFVRPTVYDAAAKALLAARPAEKATLTKQLEELRTKLYA